MSIGNAAGHHQNGHAQLMSSIGGQQQGFHQINNNNAMMNKCAGCGSKYTHFIYARLERARRCSAEKFHQRSFPQIASILTYHK